MSAGAAIVILIVSIIIAKKICDVVFQNSIATTGACIKRGFMVWGIVFFALLWIWAKITGYNL